jgi:hypothetical protein
VKVDTRINTTTANYLDALHRTRLLQVEEKPFKKITKRIFQKPLKSNTTEVTDGEDDKEATSDLAAGIERLHQDIDIDFALFESSIIRIQLLRTSNARERVKYEEKKQQITKTSVIVTESIAQLRGELEIAQQRLALRKQYDELADKITSNRMLRSREEQKSSIDKLNSEIAELEAQSAEYAKTWSERKEQFGRIVHEGMELRRQIRDEKEEVERREGMAEHDTDGDRDDAPKDTDSVAADSPMPDAGDAGQSSDSNNLLQVSVLNRMREANSTAVTPAGTAPPSVRDEGEVEDDTNMSDEGEIHTESNSPKMEGSETPINGEMDTT